MSKELIQEITKAGIAFMLSAALCGFLYLEHEERVASRKEDRDRLMPVLERLAESTEMIAKTYSGK